MSIADVPTGWQIEPLGKHFRERRENVSDAEYEPLSVSMRGVLPRMENVAISFNGENRKLVRKGDFVINSRSDRKGAAGVSDRDGSVSLISIVLEPKGIERRFIHHLMRSIWFQEEFYIWGSGIVDDLWSTRFQAMKRINLPIPPVGEQRCIADYLDRETATIDALIEKQRQLIAGLNERRRSAISRLVVEGVKGAHTRETGDPYFPKISAGWTLQALGYGYDVVLGKMLDAKRPPRLDDVDLPYVRAANIKDGYLDLSDVNSMAFGPEEVMRLDLRVGDLLVVEGGSVGQSALLSEPMPGWSFQKTVNRVRSKGHSSTRYLHFVLSHMRSREHFDLICSGSTIAHLTAEKLRAIRIPIPPLAEQREIADHLDRETAKIDTLIAKAERFIELAQERRAALITAAVTGQIEIPTED